MMFRLPGFGVRLLWIGALVVGWGVGCSAAGARSTTGGGGAYMFPRPAS